MEEISVEFFNGFTRKTVGRGAIKPKTSIIVTSNKAFSESQRFAVAMKECSALIFFLFDTLGMLNASYTYHFFLMMESFPMQKNWQWRGSWGGQWVWGQQALGKLSNWGKDLCVKDQGRFLRRSWFLLLPINCLVCLIELLSRIHYFFCPQDRWVHCKFVIFNH